jgi:hypothetical protein
VNYWDQEGRYPMVSRVGGEGGEPQYRIELVEVTLPHEPPLSPARVGPEQLRKLHERDYMVRGAMELDYFLSITVVGEKNERKACIRVALAVDADSGIVFPPELASPGVSVGDALATAIMNSIETSHSLPKEIRVLDQKFKSCLEPIADACGIQIKVVDSLPALAEARSSMLQMLEGNGFPGF